MKTPACLRSEKLHQGSGSQSGDGLFPNMIPKLVAMFFPKAIDEAIDIFSWKRGKAIVFAPLFETFSQRRREVPLRWKDLVL